MYLRLHTLICLVCVSLCLPYTTQAETPPISKKTLNMGVYAFQDKDAQQSHYNQLTDALNQRLTDYQLHISVMDDDQLLQALEAHQLDLLFTNPVIYQRLRKEYALISPIATVKMRFGNHSLSSLGGVIFQRADQPTIETLEQLIHKRIAIPGHGNAGAYALPVYELHKHKVRPEEIEWITLNHNDAVVSQVMAGKADAGFVRTGILENWIAQGKLSPDDIRVIHNNPLTAYPLRLSTELIPEWPVYAMAHVPEKAIKALTSALFSVEAHWPGANALHIDSFSPAADYVALEHILYELRLPPFDMIPQLRWSEVWHNYQPTLLTAAFAFMSVLSLLFWVSYLYRQQARHSQQLKQASLIFDASVEGIVVTDANRRIVNVNRAFETISGYTKADVIGLDPRFLQSGKQPESFYVSMWKQLNQTGFWRGEVLNRRKNGALYPELLTIYAISDDNKAVQNYVAIFSDISQQKAQQAKLERLLHYDVLTGLPNRALLNDRVKQALIQAKEHQHYLAIVFIDLDGFKAVNDLHGHDMGDALLTELGNRFLSIMPVQGTIARIGGDEFIAVMSQLPSRESAYPLLDQLLDACRRPFVINQQELNISASIGVDFYTPNDYDRDISEVNLIKQADVAMYIAKQQGKNQIWFFDQTHRTIEPGIQPHGA